MTDDYALGETIDHFFTTRSFTTGAPTSLIGIPDIEVYEDNTATAIASGLTLNTDFGSPARTGLNHIRIVATSGNGFESGKSYCVVINGGTVGGVSVVGEVVWHFTIDRQALRPTTAGNTLDVNANGEAGLDLDNTSGTLAAAQIADNAITAAKIAANAITAAKIATDAITASQIAANAIGASEIADNAITAAKIATDAITNAKIAAGAITSSEAPNLDAAVSSRATPAQVNTEVDTALADVNLDHLVGTATGIPALPAGTYFDQIRDDGTEVFDRTTDSLQAIRDRGDAAWTTGAGGSPPDLLQSTTIATLASQTSFTLTAGSGDNDAYNNQIAVFTDQTTPTQKAVGRITDYVGSTRTVTLEAAPAFTIAIGDTIDIIAVTNRIGLVDTVTTNSDMRGTDNALLAASAPTNFGDLAITASTGLVSVGSLANNVITTLSINDGAITAAKFGAGAITATVIATDAIDADALSTDAVNEMADGFLNRDMSTGTDSGSSTVRTPRQAFRFLRNRWTSTTGTLTVYKEDDSTTSWTGTLTTDASAEPIVENNPVGGS